MSLWVIRYNNITDSCVSCTSINIITYIYANGYHILLHTQNKSIKKKEKNKTKKICNIFIIMNELN